MSTSSMIPCLNRNQKPSPADNVQMRFKGKTFMLRNDVIKIQAREVTEKTLQRITFRVQTGKMTISVI